ncbi:hypothetical protein D915_001021 [Fasciola hepatica]|uniref:Uncharacterized protein n=1 Tax=Fasciola hepatica TaxID=6192 RepID=A0A4E0S3V2_FASHE|nr:hypothetical protein D915_001021 [Fasciola hepatica]
MADMEEPISDYTDNNKMNNVSESSDVPVSQDFTSALSPDSDMLSNPSETSRQEEEVQPESEHTTVSKSTPALDDNADNLNLTVEINDISNELYVTSGGPEEPKELPSATGGELSTCSSSEFFHEETDDIHGPQPEIKISDEENYCPGNAYQMSVGVTELPEEKDEPLESEIHSHTDIKSPSGDVVDSCAEGTEYVREIIVPEAESVQREVSDLDEGDSIVSNLAGSDIDTEVLEGSLESPETGLTFEDGHTVELEKSKICAESIPNEESSELEPSGEKLIQQDGPVGENVMLQGGEAIVAPVSFVPGILDGEVEVNSDVENSQMDYKPVDNEDEQDVKERLVNNKISRVVDNDTGEPSEEISADVNEFGLYSADQTAFNREISGSEQVLEKGEEQEAEVILFDEQLDTDHLLAADRHDNAEQKEEGLDVHEAKEKPSNGMIDEQGKSSAHMVSNDIIPDSLGVVSMSSEAASPKSEELPVFYATQESVSTQFETVEELNKLSQDQASSSPEHVTVEENANQERVHPQQQQPEVNEPIHSDGTRDRPVCFTQTLELEQDRLSIEPMEEVFVDHAESSEYTIDTSCVVDVCKSLETVNEREEVEQFTSTDQPAHGKCEQLSEVGVGASGQGKLNSETISEMASSQSVLYATEERDFSVITNGELGEESESMIKPTRAAQIHRTHKSYDRSDKAEAGTNGTITADQAELLISVTEQEQQKANMINGHSPDSDELHSDKENDDRAVFEEKYARLVSKILPRDQNVFDSEQRKERSKTLEPNFDTNQLKNWNESQTEVKRKSATLGRSGSRKRPRLLPKPSVNDDHLFPDSVTPSKVDRNLSVRSLSVGLPEGTYDVPYIDDDAFVPRRLRTQLVDNDKDENGSGQSTESDEYMWDPSLSRYSALDPAHRADIDECIQTPQLVPKTAASAPRGKNHGVKNLIKENKNKGPKKRRFLDLCGCMGRPNRK